MKFTENDIINIGSVKMLKRLHAESVSELLAGIVTRALAECSTKDELFDVVGELQGQLSRDNQGELNYDGYLDVIFAAIRDPQRWSDEVATEAVVTIDDSFVGEVVNLTVKK